jgi:serine phosphatase RsbU (regulator of sigma subunit)
MRTALAATFWRRLATIGTPLLIIALVLTPLIIGTTWMYRASAEGFQFQHEVRVAQNARDRVMKLFLASEVDVRGFAATNDPYFSAHYRANSQFFASLSTALENSVRRVGVSGGVDIVLRESATYERWTRDVAAPILAEPRSQARHLLRIVDPSYVSAMLGDDRKLGGLLDDASARSDNDRQRLLRGILLGSELLVVLVTTIVAALLYARAAAQRRILVQSALYVEEQRITAMLQLALTPEQLPTISGIALSAIYVPAGSILQVGGDWYEACELSDGRVFLLIGDVAGHGLEAAVTMNRARQAILAAAVTQAEPASILMRANRLLCAQSAGMVTAACCLFDPATRRLEYATAGHPPPIVLPTTTPPYVLANGGAPLGIVDDLKLESFTLVVGEGCMLILYTDGLIEEEHDVVAGERRLLLAAEQSRSASDPSAALFEATFSGAQPRDDVAILTMRLAALNQPSPATIACGTAIARRTAKSCL